MKKIQLIAIGASTGGTDAIYSVLSLLPENVPPILIVQHMPSGFTSMYAGRLNSSCKMSVREAADYDKLGNGVCLIAPGGYQTRLAGRNGEYYVRVETGDKVTGHAPSADFLFHSVAEVFKDYACGIILTGMGSDGAAGLYHMRTKGFLTIGQDKSSCVVYGMPKVAFEMGAVSFQGNPREIAQVILKNI